MMQRQQVGQCKCGKFRLIGQLLFAAVLGSLFRATSSWQQANCISSSTDCFLKCTEHLAAEWQLQLMQA